MKKLILLVLILFKTAVLNAQTGIGTTTPDASAKLEVNSSNKGFLPPRVTLTSGTDTTTIPSPATGLLVYNTGNNPGLVAGYYYWNGTSWATIATATGSGVSSSYLRGSRSAAQTTNLSVNSLVAFSQVDNVSGQEISLNTTTGQITLAAGRTYRLMAQVPNMSGGTRPAFAWYNETTSSWVGSQSSIYGPADAASYIAFGSVSDAIITTNATTVISYRIYSGSSIGSLGGNADFNTVGSYPWFDIQVISGNAPFNQFNFGDVKTGFQTSDHNGWIKLDGRLKSSLSSAQQAQATTLGIGTNLPDATNSVLMQNGGTLGAISGSNTKTIAQANLPNVTLSGTTGADAGHTHTIPFTTSTMNLAWGVSTPGGAGYTIAGNASTTTSATHTHSFTTSSMNGGVTQTALDITPKSLSVNTFIYLGY